MNRMNLECLKNLLVLDDVELKECNGGTTVFPEQASNLPITIWRLPLPDGDHRL
jgi:hypothetical protein